MMNNRVYGIIGVKAIRSNWNADFTGRPRTSATGNIISTDKALKYAIRNYWNNEGEKILYFRSLKENLNPRSLKERYESFFDPIEKGVEGTKVLLNLFSCLDIMNFGAAFVEGNISIAGAVQIQDGINVYKSSKIETLDILSPFRNKNDNSNGSEKTQSSIGEFVLADKVQYLFPFTVNPENYNEFSNVEGFEGYTHEAYNKFKVASRVCVSAINSKTKAGCENDFTLFVELNENSKYYLPSLIDYINYNPADSNKKDSYDLTKLFEILDEVKKEIASVEIYYNPYTIDLKYEPKKLGNLVKEINIFSDKVL